MRRNPKNGWSLFGLTKALQAQNKLEQARMVEADFKKVWADAGDESFHLALLSDTHIAANPLDANRKFLPTENLKTVLSQVTSARPAGVIINGDIARLSGELADYEAVKTHLRALGDQVPIYLVLGNHDDRAQFRAAFPEAPTDADGFVQSAFATPVGRFLLLDTNLPGSAAGGLCARRLGPDERRELLDGGRQRLGGDRHGRNVRRTLLPAHDLC